MTEEESSTMDGKVFDFYGLPGELRNEIYALLTQQKTLDSGYDHGDDDARRIAARLDNIPLPKAFTLCRQLKSEYEDIFKHNFTIVCKDLGPIDGPYWLANIPRGIAAAEFLLLAICGNDRCSNDWCDGCEDLETHVSWIMEFVHEFEGLKDLTFRVYKCQIVEGNEANGTQHLALIDKSLSQLTEMPLATCVEVYPVFMIKDGDRNPWDAVEAYDAKSEPESVWTRKDGWKK